MVLLGAMLWAVDLSFVTWWFIPLLFLVVRPLAVGIGLAGSIAGTQRRMIAWFGVRGIGSLYYLSYAKNHGLGPEMANTLTALTLTAIVVASILAHGISVTPLMERYERVRGRGDRPRRGDA